MIQNFLMFRLKVIEIILVTILLSGFASFAWLSNIPNNYGCIDHVKLQVGSRDCAVVRALTSHQCGPGSIPRLGIICGLSLLLVLVLAPRDFSPGTWVFPSPKKPTLLNPNSIWKVSPIIALR